jgi:hypothetical protein
MYVPTVSFLLRGVGTFARNGAMTAAYWFAAAYHPPVKPKDTRPLEDPAPSTISAANSCGRVGSWTKCWKAARAAAAAEALRSQEYSKTVVDAGAAKVFARMAVTMPKELDAPLSA